ncbi:hypothetical protein KCU95_g38, partial [Aureobasidium melanogenum]
MSDGRLFNLTARKSHPAMIQSNKFAAVSSNAIGWWDPASCCIFCCSFWIIVVFDFFYASEWYYKAEQARNKSTSGLAMMLLHELKPADSDHNSFSPEYSRALKIIYADVFDGLLADAKTSYDGYTLRMNNVETTNIVEAGAPDYTMGFEHIGNMMRTMIDLSLHKVGVRQDDRRTLENCYQLDPLVALPPNKSSAADLISRSSTQHSFFPLLAWETKSKKRSWSRRKLVASSSPIPDGRHLTTMMKSASSMNDRNCSATYVLGKYGVTRKDRPQHEHSQLRLLLASPEEQA